MHISLHELRVLGAFGLIDFLETFHLINSQCIFLATGS